MKAMRTTAVVCGLLAVAVVPSGAQPPGRLDLQPPSAFERIENKSERSRAIFAEIGKLLTHPRCLNCHPAGDRPLQGADRRQHFPPAQRGEADAGVPGNLCSTCHTGRNVTLHAAASFRSIPGHPRWQLAPRSMAWENRSLGEICTQLKDKERNSGRDLALLHEHIAEDDLVAWGWAPGEGREPAPGNQKLAGELVQAWIDSGAECP
jgi:hypothetical protein